MSRYRLLMHRLSDILVAQPTNLRDPAHIASLSSIVSTWTEGPACAQIIKMWIRELVDELLPSECNLTMASRLLIIGCALGQTKDLHRPSPKCSHTSPQFDAGSRRPIFLTGMSFVLRQLFRMSRGCIAWSLDLAIILIG